ncbi:MAG: hypothetical protein ACFBSD_15105 [Paracoccaceae bacterium]
MQSVLMITGLFAGISVCMACLYSVGQAMMEEGRTRWANLAQVIAILAVMGALLEREVEIARVLALPLFLTAVWVFAVERGWFRIFPILTQIFAGVVLAGYVAF